MSEPRVMLHVQHLLGTGHLWRVAALARAMAARGLGVDLVSGGMPVSGLALGGARLVQLPPLAAADARFSGLLDVRGNPVDEAWRAARRDRLLAVFAERRPDALVIESYPFGRRQLRFELEPLIAAACARRPRPRVVVSVRDIVQRRRPERVAEALAIIDRAVDAVLVHGDPTLVRLEDSVPGAARIAGVLHYTGYVAAPPEPRGRPGEPGWGEVVVSAGGGAVGGALLSTALAARRLSTLVQAPWRLITGENLPEGAFIALSAAAPEGVAIERFRPDFRRLLANCSVSVSQGGYNTVMDITAARARAVIVPFVGDDETEQSLRAERLARRGLVRVVAEADLDAETLARAIDAAAEAPRPARIALDMSGAETSAALVSSWLAGRAVTNDGGDRMSR